jgi:hypothetical protein
MSYDKPYIQSSANPYRSEDSKINVTRTIYYGEVVFINDPTEGGRIKVRIDGLDITTSNEDLPWCYPMQAKFFHVYPQVGEMVRIFLENVKYPQRARFWQGSIISQPQKIKFDGVFTALSTTNMVMSAPLPAPNTFPDAVGVFPTLADIAIVGRVNTDVILRINEVHIRAGKHENDNILKLNTKNPAEISLIYEQSTTSTIFQSTTVIASDRIALISHSGDPQFKAACVEQKDRDKMFTEGHPIGRGDVIAQAFEIFRRAMINHIHGYSNLPADKNAVINELEKLDFSGIYNKNIVIN